MGVRSCARSSDLGAPLKQPSAASCYCSIRLENSRAPVAVKPVANQPRCAQVFLCGALLGRAGHRLVLHLSASWGSLKPRISLLENILSYGVPTSPKLHSGLAT